MGSIALSDVDSMCQNLAHIPLGFKTICSGLGEIEFKPAFIRERERERKREIESMKQSKCVCVCVT